MAQSGQLLDENLLRLNYSAADNNSSASLIYRDWEYRDLFDGDIEIPAKVEPMQVICDPPLQHQLADGLAAFQAGIALAQGVGVDVA
jgi:hypothetical protein